MMPIIRPLPGPSLDEEAFYQLGARTPRNQMQALFKLLRRPLWRGCSAFAVRLLNGRLCAARRLSKGLATRKAP